MRAYKHKTNKSTIPFILHHQLYTHRQRHPFLALPSSNNTHPFFNPCYPLSLDGRPAAGNQVNRRVGWGGMTDER
ncbi:hypothetical protein HanRHA438_Chr09g0400531 [Helianthus annuus]|uniref:Uncharacterized protein n=1 Tax=Helianthus annuus TaxID=4232 RepID=A0A251TVH9_HELAN|nr:hypothetical protein HanXRQr2_Chr09g0389041 [Helianthus annuus]KAJ0534395.1 hypothetical protein HanIR_Chr09g0419321 [Helianthus annuus]KAJ0534397.1 hypothetical protein HanIR_Chr09g0419341 [Helianthus annuus]KAJ0888301.1 hypothetical protein HanRHA438_Chr09g0400531 [Helianthus annuus]KAJ0893196.1 hypothetical protein HanPSC8_Chr09g0374891 [Helianthus annuus]